MLHLILGRCGSGKTTDARQKAAALSASTTEKIIFIVPEQYSFETERAFLRLAGAKGANQIEVLSFTRLADTVFRLYGGTAGIRLDDAGRMVLIGSALEALEPQLKLFAKQVRQQRFAEELLVTLREFKQSAVRPADLLAAAGQATGHLRSKLHELGLILTAYEALAAQSYVDPLDDLARLAERLWQHDYFNGKTVFIDAFKDFTRAELDVLKNIIARAKDTYITLCADSLRPAPVGLDLFAQAKETAEELMQIAAQHGVKIAQPEELPGGVRYQNESLRAVESGFFSATAPQKPAQSNHVRVYAAQNAYDEAVFAARTICRLIRDEGYRCREIAVLARDAGDYAGVLHSVFHKYEIPFFLDQKRLAASLPLFVLVKSALSAALQSFKTEDILRAAKTALCGLTLTQIAELENYLYVWGISGVRIKTPFTGHPDGFDAAHTPESTQMLERLNHLREKLVRPLISLAARLKRAKSAQQAGAAVFAYLIDIGADKALAALGDSFEKAGDPETAEQQRRSWEMMCSLLDQTVYALGATAIDPVRFQKLLGSAIDSADFGLIPSGLDQVQAGSAGRMRPGAPRAVFILGAAAGMFPKDHTGAGLLTPKERAGMKALGLCVAEHSENQVLEERFLAYTAVAAPSERLYVSWPRINADGQIHFPSAIVTQIEALLPPCQTGDEPFPEVQSAGSAREALALRWDQADPQSLALKSLAAAHPRLSAMHAALQNTAAGLDFTLSQKVAAQLFDGDMTLSPSRVEKFFHCRFSYFCAYVLKAQPRRMAELNVLQRGTLIHYVLEQMVRNSGGKGLNDLSDQELTAQVEQCLSEYLHEFLGGATEKSTRFMYVFSKLSETLVPVLRYLGREFAQSGFVPAAFELVIGPQGDVPAAELPLSGGGILRIVGKIDRVDVCELDGRKYLRVVDYKTGGQTFALADILSGLNMQMLIYLFTLTQNGGGDFADALPAGALYLTAKRTLPAKSRDSKIEAFAPAVSGLILNHERVIRQMETLPNKNFIPVKGEIEGDDLCVFAKGLASLEMFGKLSRSVDQKLIEMGEALRQGAFSPNPLDGTQKDACAYCDYAEVCQMDQPHRSVTDEEEALYKRLG